MPAAKLLQAQNHASSGPRSVLCVVVGHHMRMPAPRRMHPTGNQSGKRSISTINDTAATYPQSPAPRKVKIADKRYPRRRSPSGFSRMAVSSSSS